LRTSGAEASDPEDRERGNPNEYEKRGEKHTWFHVALFPSAMLGGGTPAARSGAPKQVRFNENEFEMRHLLRQIELHISVASETFDPERKA